MKFIKSMALMSMGAGAVLAYQKYNKPMMNGIKNMVKSMKDTEIKILEDMME